MKKQTWRPDTCGCKVEENYDDNIETLGKVLVKCETHKDVLDDELYGVIYSNPDGENKRKNLVYGILLGLDEIKDLGLEEKKLVKDGSERVVGLRQGIEYIWSFEGMGKERKLNVEIGGVDLSSVQKKSIKDLCDKKFGLNKVNIL